MGRRKSRVWPPAFAAEGRGALLARCRMTGDLGRPILPRLVSTRTHRSGTPGDGGTGDDPACSGPGGSRSRVAQMTSVVSGVEKCCRGPTRAGQRRAHENPRVAHKRAALRPCCADSRTGPSSGRAEISSMLASRLAGVLDCRDVTETMPPSRRPAHGRLDGLTDRLRWVIGARASLSAVVAVLAPQTVMPLLAPARTTGFVHVVGTL